MLSKMASFGTRFSSCEKRRDVRFVLQHYRRNGDATGERAGFKILIRNKRELSMTANYNVLFLSSDNSTCSIMAEAILNHLGKAHFNAFSAGLHPSGTVHPLALAELRRAGLPALGCRSKSWREFAAPGSQKMHFVFTICDDIGHKFRQISSTLAITGHWSIDNPTAVLGSDEERRDAFSRAYNQIGTRLRLFLSLPLKSIHRMADRPAPRELVAA
jgi:arsenate reductase